MEKLNPRLSGAILGVLLGLPIAAIFYLGEVTAELPFLPGDLMNWIIPKIPGDLITFGIDLMVDTIIALKLGREDAVAKLFETLTAAAIFVGISGLIGVGITNIRKNKYFSTPVTGLMIGTAWGFLLALLSNFVLTNNNPFYDGQSLVVRTAWIVGLVVIWGTTFEVLFARFTALPVSTTTAKPADANVVATTPELVLATSGAASTSASVSNRVEVPVTRDSVKKLSRRQFMVQVGGTTAAITVIGAGLGALLDNGEEVVSAEQANFSFLDFPNMNAAVEAAPGTRPEYTPIDDHYRIDINSASPPSIDGDAWRLQVTGLVENSMEFTLDELQNDFSPMNQYVTISCISNRIGGSLIGTTGWTGVSMQDILRLVRPQDSATHIRITSADGFWEYVDLETVRNDERVMLTYAWNEELLREKHGFPLRIYIPDHYGMKQPKWITELEFVDEWGEGYWVERGWSETARVQVTSVVDTVAVNDRFEVDGQMFVPVGGIAYSGAKGISRVEVRVGEGEWVEAELRDPLADTTWVVWRYDWPLKQGEFTFEVRTYDGDGNMQSDRDRGTKPSGATGIHSRNASV